MLYLHLLEWQTRPYVAEKGIAWVKEELGKLPYNEFWPVEKGEQRGLYQDLMARYGGIDGVVTVVLTVSSKDDLPRTEQCIEKLLGQTLQKLDILVLSKEELELNVQDISVRWEQVESLEPEKVVEFAFTRAYGESVYFADQSEELSVRFFEWLADVMKYNACGTVILTDGPSMFVDRDSIYDRRKFRELLRDKKIPCHKALFRRDLLEESGLGCMGDVRRYMADILLTNHILMIGEG